MKNFTSRLVAGYGPCIAVFLLLMTGAAPITAQSDLEQINRGVLAVKASDTSVYVGWRLLGTDPDSVGFNLYRITDGGSAQKLNDEALQGATNYYDSNAVLTSVNEYYVVPVIDDIEQESSDTAGVWGQNYLSVPLQVPDGDTVPGGASYSYTANDASVGDLDGDGEYEIILKWDPTNSKDNSQSGYTGNTILDAYEMDGTLLWRIDLGVNVRSGAHYNPFMVYDLDQDGKAELACRTAPGTRDGSGEFLSDGPAASADTNADYRNTGGYILTGPEYLTIFKGSDGTELTTINLEPDRGDVNDWGDPYGNRVDRFLGAVAYLDGLHPSLVWCRGIYTKIEIAAYNWDGDSLSPVWMFKSQEGYEDWAGMGSHNLSVGDVDNDGKDEIVYGNCAIDDNGTGLWTLKGAVGKATGDAMHLADIVPDRPGLEKWGLCEGESSPGTHLVDAATGEVLWLTGPGDVGRCTAGDLVAEFYGMECWGGTDGLRSCYNVRVGNAPSSVNFVVWWDGDLSRELLDGNSIRKYSFAESRENEIFTATGCSSNNSTKATPTLQADLFGDWREEVIWRTSDNTSLRIYTTTIPTQYRIQTLMHDHQYRLAIAWQNDSYNQPPHPGFYLGNDMFTPVEEIPPSAPAGFALNVGTEFIGLSWTANKEGDLAGYNIYKSTSGGGFVLLRDTLITSTTVNDSAIVLDTQYKYYITAVDTDKNESTPTGILPALPTYKPDPPSVLRGRNGFGKALVFWNSVDAKDNPGSRKAATVVPASAGAIHQEGLVLMHAYTFADGTADDTVGSAHGTVNGGTFDERAYITAADPDHVKLDGSQLALDTYSAITLEAYVDQYEGNSGNYTMIAYFGGSSGTGAYWIQPTRKDNASRVEYNGSYVLGPELSKGKHHIVTVLTDDSLFYYLDGSFQGATATTNSIPEINLDTALFCKGGWSDASWLGELHEFNIYDGVMNEATVAVRSVNFPYDIAGPTTGEIIGYNVYASESPGSGYLNLNSELITDTVYIHNGLENGKTYYFVVTSVDDAYRESYYPDEISLVPGDELVIQAEDGDYEDVWIESNHIGFHGTGFVNFDASGHVEFKYVYSRYGGWYNLVTRYALGKASRTGEIIVNGLPYDYTMETTPGFTDYVYDTVKVNLNAEFDNTIRFQATGSDYGNLDEIIIDGRTTKPSNTSGIKRDPSLFFYPNPFSSYTRIDLEYEGSGEPYIRIANIMGQVVRVARFESNGGEHYRFLWDGTNDRNHPLPPGIYIATVFLDNSAYGTIKVIIRK